MFKEWLRINLFKPLGANASSTLIVHSAFKGLAGTGVTPKSVCEDLTNFFPNGNVIMPTMTWRTITKDNNLFDASSTPSHTGILSEVFRTQFATHRSLHPTHSVSVLGVDAEYLTHGHHLSSGPCSKTSPYGLIEQSKLKESSYILLIGVALESCTYIHLFEELYNANAFLCSDLEQYSIRKKCGTVIEYNLQRHLKRPRDFHQFGCKLAQAKGLLLGKFNDQDIMLVSVNVLSQVLRTEFEKSSIATYCDYSYMADID